MVDAVRMETVSGPEELRDYPDSELRSLMVDKIHRDRQFMEQRAHQFARVVRAAVDDHLYTRVGYETLDDYVREVIQRPWEWVEAALRICDERPDARMADVAHAVSQARDNPASGHGGDRRSEEASEQGGLSTLKDKNTSSHWLRRLARDRPDLLDRVETGELSPNAAAIEAGFRRKKIQVEPNPVSIQRMLDRHLPGWSLVNTQTGETVEVA